MRKRGSVTVFLTLMFAVLSSFVVALVSVARLYVSKSEAKLATDCAVRSCFAEYNRELFDRFHILLIDSSYKGTTGGSDRVLEHFDTYLYNSLSSNEVISIGIVSYLDAAANDYEYLYMSALRYARSEIADDAGFTDYLVDVLDEDEIENLLRDDGVSEESFDLRDRLENTDTDVLIRWFADYLTSYLREHGSPGFDLANCYHSIAFEADFIGASNREYTVTQDYEYDIEDF